MEKGELNVVESRNYPRRIAEKVLQAQLRSGSAGLEPRIRLSIGRAESLPWGEPIRKGSLSRICRLFGGHSGLW